MKTDKFAPTETKRSIEAALAAKLNAAKHRNPPTVFAALGLPNALLAEAITVTWARDSYWVGTQSQEFAAKLGATYAEAEETIRAKKL